jgi:hypothetical protein
VNELVPSPYGAARADVPAMASNSITEHGSIRRKMRWFRAWEDNKRAEREEAREARRYYHDKQWTDTEIERLTKRGQQATVRNRIKRKLDFLVGVEQRLRRDPKAVPRTPKHEQAADVATAGLRYAFETMRFEQTASAVMHDGLVSGIGVCMMDIVRGDPHLVYVDNDRFFYDPRSVRPDFSDARYIGLHIWMDVDEAKERWPDHADKVELIVDSAMSYMTGTMLEQDRATQWGDFENRRVRVIEFWEKKASGWYFCYFSGETELESGMSPILDDQGKPACRYHAWSPYIDEKGVRYGLVRTMKSIQDEINYAASKYLHRISADRFFYEEGAIEDVDEFGRQLARPDGKIKIMNGEWGKSVGIIDQRIQIQGEAERYQLAANEIENLGPNPAMLGSGPGVEAASGRALLAQRDSGMTELSPVFERHRDWKLRVYRSTWSVCKQVWQGEKWIRITDDEAAPGFIGLNQYQQLPDGTLAAENVVAEMDVDIILSEGPDTITVNEELMQTLSGLGQAALTPLGKVMIELSNAPNKERLLKMMDQAMQPPPPPPEVVAMQQRMAELEAALAAANVDEKIAGIEAKRASTLKTLIEVATPPQQQTDEFGNTTGAPPQPPDLMSAMAALQMFPLQYGEPTMLEMGMQPPMPPDMMGGPEGMPPPDQPMQGAPMPPAGMEQGMDPMMQVQPEQITPNGGLPLDLMA